MILLFQTFKKKFQMAAKTEGGFTNRVDALKQTVEEVVRTTKKLIIPLYLCLQEDSK